MKSPSLCALALLVFAVPWQAHAQAATAVQPSCHGLLLRATEANGAPLLEAALKQFEIKGCVGKPTQDQLDAATVEGLSYMLYRQSRKRASAMAAVNVGADASTKVSGGDVKADMPKQKSPTASKTK